MKIDLHCHSTLSDGSVNVSEILDMAVCRGLDVLAVTDHDTFSGAKQAQRLAAAKGITIVPGTEISTLDYTRKRKVHILCYYPQKPLVLEEILRKTTQNRMKAMLAVLPQIGKAYRIPEEMIWARRGESETIYKQHVMHALMDAGYADSMFGDVFRYLFGSDGIARTKVEYPDVLTVLEKIQEAGGLAVMAHPGEYKSLELLEELLEKNLLVGAECYHPKNTEEDKAIIQNLCRHYDKIMTGGTDFHGSYGGRKHAIGSFLTPENEYVRLANRKLGKENENSI
ncbi:PHP domain-containing protein [Scatolibacter rhodanostii]|uniref:PHP domain-containing protein n=1 Tax=Scatolibacter rhodanostii TaxID=2014781 RepID=UPI000C0757C9|nr:PHP domain-containing protein [Scatolibacter rhodanostii]